jgi:hypothetical protein
VAFFQQNILLGSSNSVSSVLLSLKESVEEGRERRTGEE